MVSIREITPEDGELLLPLLKEWEGEAIFDVEGFNPKAEIALETTLVWANPENETCVGFVMIHEEQAVGLITCFQHGWGVAEPLWATEGVLYVQKGFGGHARKLLSAAEGWARSRGCTRFSMEATPMSSEERSARADVWMRRMGYRPFFSHLYKEL